MTKNDYLHILHQNIFSLPLDEIEEIMSDVASHFDFGLEEGKTEAEVCEQLGSPLEMARQFTGGNKSYAHETFRRPEDKTASFIRIALMVFGGMMIVPFVITIYALIATFVILGIVLVIVAIVVVIAVLLQIGLPVAIFTGISAASSFMLALGFVVLGLGLSWLSIIAFKAFNQIVRRTLKMVEPSFAGAR